MKILHTADWHIGKMLYKNVINDELALFFDWLISIIKSEKIDVLLVSGDIFDLANPSNTDIKMYYELLRRLMEFEIKVIIIGGNHDSVSMLNAPRDILSTLDIHVIGGATEDIGDEIIPIYNEVRQCELVVLAVPFLRDRDLRQSVAADEELGKSEVLPVAIKKHYDTLVTLALERYGHEMPIVAMGHLFLQGASTSDSERDIHVGNLMGIGHEIFHPSIQYVALGHIHKPQRVAKLDHIRYSGSPVFLDFSEVSYKKGVIVLQIENKKMVNVETVPIPVFRDLKRISGHLDILKHQLAKYQKKAILPTFYELTFEIEHWEPTVLLDIENFVNEKNSEYRIIKHIIQMTTSRQSELDTKMDNATIDTLTPLDILQRRLETEAIDDLMRQDIKEIYAEIVQDIHQDL